MSPAPAGRPPEVPVPPQHVPHVPAPETDDGVVPSAQWVPPPTAPRAASSAASPSASSSRAGSSGAGPTSSGDVLDALERLGALRERGVLTEDEFKAKKAELLARL